MIDSLEKPPKTHRKTDLKTLFVPVIFANGKDDDIPGLVAAIENKVVQFDDDLYQPGEELTITNRTLLFSKGLCILGHDDAIPEDIDTNWCIAREGKPHRRIEVAHCFIKIVPPHDY
jgi:hypothetical protein